MQIIEELKGYGVDPAEFKEAAKNEIQRRQRAEYLLSHPMAFFKEVVCLKDKRDRICQFHKEGLDFVNSGKRKKLILWPRGHLKSTLLTQGETLRRALKDPDIRILLGNKRWDNSKTFLRAIKGTLIDSEFVSYFGNLLPPANDRYYKNNDAELTLTNRRNLTLREATFTTTGLECTLTSQHYDLIVLDDMVDWDLTTSPDMLEKPIQFYKQCIDLLNPGGEIWVIGTRYHPLDLYGWIIDGRVDPKCREEDFVHQGACSCVFDVTLRMIKEGNDFIFPTVFNQQEADERLLEEGRYHFATQYLNNPVDPSNCWFLHSWLDNCQYDPETEEFKEIRKRLIWYVSIDPAESIEKKACFTAAVAVGIDPETGIWYVDYAKQTKVETPGFIDLCFDVQQRFNPVKFGMELNTRKALGYAVRDKMIQRGVYFTITELRPDMFGGGKVLGKEIRIKRLLPKFEFGLIKINKNLKDLLNLLYTVPSATSFDLPDALSYMLDLVPQGFGGGKPKNLPKKYYHWKGISI